MDDLDNVEDVFEVSIHVYSLQENKSAEVVRISQKSYEKVMHLNLYDSHFSYITKFSSYAKKYQCPTCSRFIGNVKNLPRHISRCQVEVEEVYVGGKFKPKKTVFEELDELGIKVPEEDRFDPYFSVFDFEAMAIKTQNGTVEQGKTLHATHVPATVSICSNIPGHEQPVHLQTDGDPQKQVDNFVDVLLEQQKTRVAILNKKYEPVLTQLNDRITELRSFLGIKKEDCDDVDDKTDDNNDSDDFSASHLDI